MPNTSSFPFVNSLIRTHAASVTTIGSRFLNTRGGRFDLAAVEKGEVEEKGEEEREEEREEVTGLGGRRAKLVDFVVWYTLV